MKVSVKHKRSSNCNPTYSPLFISFFAHIFALPLDVAAGLCQLDDMKVRFLAEMSKLKSETVAQADRVCQQWRDLSHETREAEVRLQSVKQLVEVLGTHV